MNLRRQYPCEKHEGAVLKREEDPSIRKILEGKTTLCWVYMQKFQSMWLKEEPQKQKYNLGPSALSTSINNSQQNYHSNRLVVTPNKILWIACINCCD